MTQLSIKIPAKLEAKARQRASERGHASLDAYVKSLVLADVEDDTLEPELEKLLIERLNDPGPYIEYNEDFKRKFLSDMNRRRTSPRKARR